MRFVRDAFGTQRTKRMLMLGEVLDAHEALASGFLHRLCEADAIDAEVAAWCAAATALAPLTQQVSKEGLRRVAVHALPDGDDLVRRCYGSADFKEGVAAFMAGRPAQWQGR